MDLMTSAKTCLVEKYVTFKGRASRSEYWYFQLFLALAPLVPIILLGVLAYLMQDFAIILVIYIFLILFFLGILLPITAVTVRRLHDSNRSGWWIFISFVPIIGALILLYWYIIKGTEGANDYGEDPLYIDPASVI